MHQCAKRIPAEVCKPCNVYGPNHVKTAILRRDKRKVAKVLIKLQLTHVCKYISGQ